jgi:glycosyltransferase involved in cell wall biosynthesis
VNNTTGAPLVSIGLPVYNGARYLSRALDALLAQRLDSLEILISDNASTDETAAICQSYARRDPRIRYVRADANAGVEANFKKVLGMASGTYFMWAGCDDWWAPEFVPRLVSALEERPEAVVAMSAVERIDESGRLLDVVRHAGRTDPSRMSAAQLVFALAGGRPYHLFIYGLYRTAFLERTFTGFPSVIAADRLFMVRAALCGGFAYVDDVLHRRLVREKPIAERYADERIGHLWQGSWPRWRLALVAGPYLWRTPGLPVNRRLLVAAVVLRFLKASLGHTLVRAGLIGRRLDPWARAW